MIKNVCVFASSCNFLEKSYYKEAEILEKIIGIMPEKLKDMAENSESCDEFYVTKGMRERKAKMDEMSDAIIALPGGFGTLEEVSEMIVQKQLGYNKKPVVFLNTNGFYDNLFKFFDNILEQNFANKKARELYYIANTPKDAIQYLQTYVERDLAVTKEEIYSR